MKAGGKRESGLNRIVFENEGLGRLINIGYACKVSSNSPNCHCPPIETQPMLVEQPASH